MAIARRVAAELDIPFYVVDAQDEFYQTVVNYFLDGYAQAITPNPCLACNRGIRWDFLLNQAQAMGAAYMATGHYARLIKNKDGQLNLLRAIDIHKDQSYILHVLSHEQLSKTIFPLGNYKKSEVRDIARKYKLLPAERSDSQDLCFLAGDDYREFIKRSTPEIAQTGTIVNKEGNRLGEHQGLAFYTIGQRKGIGISSAEPLYVIDKDLSNNQLIVGHKDELGKDELIANNVNWISITQPSTPFNAQIKIRYRAKEQWGTVTPQDYHRIHVKFDNPVRDITPGQAAVLYDNDLCLGGGIIQSAT
jgi:tRNA-specific 2-thiouridylase